MHLVSNCPLCEEKGLHVIGEKEIQTQQCINCGYVTSEKFKYKIEDEHLIEDLKVFKELTEDMRNWSVRKNNYIWIPTMMTLPFGMLYPFNTKDSEMKWAFAKMVDIPENERKNYPVEGQKDIFYERMFDTDNAEIFNFFVEGLVELNKIAKFEENEQKVKKIKLPKLKKTE